MPPDHPAKDSLCDLTPELHLKALLLIAMPDDLGAEIQMAGLLHELEKVMSVIGKETLDLWPSPSAAIEYVWVPALSEASALVRLIISNRPSGLLAMCRLRLTAYPTASTPCGSSDGALAGCLSITGALAPVSRPSRSRSILNSWILWNRNPPGSSRKGLAEPPY